MGIKSTYLIIATLISLSGNITGQIDSIGPGPPLLDLVTVNPANGNVDISWQKSISPDVSVYVVYLYIDNAGFPLDTIDRFSPTNYTYTGSGSSYYSESYVVAAFDSSGNFSPLSNSLNTIYTEAGFDTCNNRLSVKWTPYNPFPVSVTDYSIMVSVEGGTFSEAGRYGPDVDSILIEDFLTGKEYCFVVRANLSNGRVSESNMHCLSTRMQRIPEWINADYASVDNDNIKLSFTIDPLSEITTYRLEKKSADEGDFQVVSNFSSVKGSLIYTDDEADISKINYYRLAAVNSCGIPVAYSNIASNIVLTHTLSDDVIELTWNSYKNWAGSLASYRLLINTGGNSKEMATIYPPDTLYNLSYPGIMYEVTGKEICLVIKAIEESNPYGVTGESTSSSVCFPVMEEIAVPNLFIPEGNVVKEVNRYFRPVLSFTPSDYHLQITDLRHRVVFETRDFLENWDGRNNGALLPEGVYLWFLKVRTPAGNTISRTGTVTLKINPL